MTTTSLFRTASRIGVGVLFAGMILGQAGTALADTSSPADAATASKTAESAYTDYSDVDDYSDVSDEVDAIAPALFLDGTVSGRLELTSVSCDLLTDTAWTWQALGTVDGVPADVTFTTNFYRGPGDYNPTTITDEDGGQVTAQVGDVQVASNGFTEGVYTVDAGEQSGYIDAVLTDDPNGLSIRVSGTWQCFAP